MHATLIRPFLSGICLLAATGAMAQTIPAAMDRAPGDRPMLIEDGARTPGVIPEIIRAPGEVSVSRAVTDPGAVLTPPAIDQQIFAWGRPTPR